MPEQRLVPTRQLTEVADCLEAMATGKGGWAWADVLDELRAIIDGPGAELPPQYPKQAKTMLICDGEDVSPAEVGHWFSPAYIAELLAAPPAPVQSCECEGYPGIAHDFETAKRRIAELEEKLVTAQAVPDGMVLVSKQFLNGQLYSLLTDIQNGIDSPATCGIANLLVRKIDALMYAAPQPPVTAQPSAATCRATPESEHEYTIGDWWKDLNNPHRNR